LFHPDHYYFDWRFLNHKAASGQLNAKYQKSKGATLNNYASNFQVYWNKKILKDVPEIHVCNMTCLIHV